MPSKFKISESDKTIKVRFNWLSADLAILLIFFVICLVSFLYMGYAILNAEKVPISFFLGYFFAFLFICYLGYATMLTLFNRTDFSLDNEELIVKRKPFYGLEYPASIPVSNLDKFQQKNYLFFFYKVVAKQLEGDDVPVFSYHYYDRSLFSNLQFNVNKLLGRETQEEIDVSKSNTVLNLEDPSLDSSATKPLNDLNMYARPVVKKEPKKKLFTRNKKQIVKSEYPGTQAPGPTKKVKKKVRKPVSKSRKQRRQAAPKQQFVSIGDADFGMDQTIFIKEEQFFIKRIFHYIFEDNTRDKVYQLVPKNNRRRFFYIQYNSTEPTIHEETELDYNQAKTINFKPNEPAETIEYRGYYFKRITSKTGYSKSIETGNEILIKQWLYHAENGDNTQIRFVEGDGLVKAHSGKPLPPDYLTVKK